MKIQLLYSCRRALAPVISTALVVLFLSICLNTANSQGYFEDAINNPFGLNLTPSESNLVFHALADIDADGDLDVFVSQRVFLSPCWEVTAFDYYENQGSSECPAYMRVPDETFGLPELTAALTFVDIDKDGDLDAFISDHCVNSVINFHENKGSATEPQFDATPTLTLNTDWGIAFAMLAFGDLDGDGDYDALVNGLRPAVFKYVENTGTAAEFEFAPPVDNPFNLSIPLPNSSEWAQFTDWDCDGDLDILNSHWLLGTSHNNWRLYIHLNDGSPTAPSFLPPVNSTQIILAIALGDMDGDGDVDVFSDEYYFKNTAATTCVTMPAAGFSTVKHGLTVEFVNESTGQATECRPIEYSWYFGDGMTSEEPSPTHTFAAEGTYNICLTIEDIAGKTTMCKDVEVLVSAVSQQENGHGMSISPNPANDYFTVKMAGEILPRPIVIEVINPLGEVVRRQTYNAPDFSAGVRVNVSGLTSGVYTARIISEGRFLSGHFLKVE